jgi:hypothetical protein
MHELRRRFSKKKKKIGGAMRVDNFAQRERLDYQVNVSSILITR